MSLEAAFEARVGAFDLAVALSAPADEVTAVIGPNGAGKTTLLRCLAGTQPVDAGTVALEGRILDRPPSTFVVPERRGIGFVHQDHLLFPHLRVVDNVAFGLRCRGRTRSEARRQARGWLARVGMEEHEAARPGSLSGGQAQRVALVRALASEPRALLLDEPLAALDPAVRSDVRRELRRHLGAFGGPAVLVTHDPVDALVLADRVVVLDGGRVAQDGTIAEVTARPRSGHVAALLGTNLLRGTATGGVLELEGGGRLVAATVLTDGEHFATVAPAAIALHREEPRGSPRNRWPVRVRAFEPAGERVRVRLAGPPDLVAEVVPASVAALDLVEGAEIWASVKATEVATYPA